MLPTKQSFTATSLLILALLSQSTLAATIQTTECDIIGDPDVYGPGVRLGFYLQWSSILIFQFLAPSYGDMMRPASAVTALAVYINTLRNLDHNSLVTIDWPILFFLTFILLVFNLPTSRVAFKRTGGSLFTVMMVLSVYYFACPWVIFRGWYNGRQAGCAVKSVLFVPINAYAHGWMIFVKVSWSLGIVAGIGCVGIGFMALFYWFVSWEDDFKEEKHPFWSYVYGALSSVLGAIAIVHVEMTIKMNHITFPDTHITDSGQLIALLIGVFTLFTAFASSVKTFRNILA